MVKWKDVVKIWNDSKFDHAVTVLFTINTWLIRDIQYVANNCWYDDDNLSATVSPPPPPPYYPMKLSNERQRFVDAG